MDDINITEKPETELVKGRYHKKKGLLFWGVVCLLVIIVEIVVVFWGFRLKGASDLKATEQYTTYQGEKYKYREGIVNILCLGIDKDIPMSYVESGRGNIGMADVIMLVSIDTEKDDIRIIAVPRDSMCDVQTATTEGVLSSKKRLQICTQYAYGASIQQGNELMVDAVSRLLYGVQIQRCCAINYDALPIINDSIGGVDVKVMEDIEEWEPKLPYGEMVHLDGQLALRFVNVRNKHIIEGAALRTQRQKQYVVAFIEKAKSVVKSNPTIPATVLAELQKDGNMYTDITVEDIAYLMPEVMDISFADDKIQTLSGQNVVGENGYTEYHLDVDAMKELIIDTFYEKVE